MVGFKVSSFKKSNNLRVLTKEKENNNLIFKLWLLLLTMRKWKELNQLNDSYI